MMNKAAFEELANHLDEWAVTEHAKEQRRAQAPMRSKEHRPSCPRYDWEEMHDVLQRGWVSLRDLLFGEGKAALVADLDTAVNSLRRHLADLADLDNPLYPPPKRKDFETERAFETADNSFWNHELQVWQICFVDARVLAGRIRAAVPEAAQLPGLARQDTPGVATRRRPALRGPLKLTKQEKRVGELTAEGNSQKQIKVTMDITKGRVSQLLKGFTRKTAAMVRVERTRQSAHAHKMPEGRDGEPLV